MSSYLINDIINAQALLFFWIIFIRRFFIVLNRNDWFIVWIGLEINMLRFMLIIRGKNRIETESCIKYFFIQRLGSGILIIRFYRQGVFMDYINGVILAYKIGGGPFYFWFPSLCAGINWNSCFLLIRIQKIIPLILISIYSSKILLFIILVRLTVGTIGAFNQLKLKRLIAYSSIHHIGWLITCVLLGEFLWMMYLFIYTFMVIGLFIIFRKNCRLEIVRLRKINRKWVVVVGIIRIGGIPPILGFFLKWLIFYRIRFLVTYIYVYIIFMSVVIIYIYIRIIYTLLIGENDLISLKILFYEDYYSLKDMIYILRLRFGSFFGLFLAI